jgi:hypothetical protein
MTTNTARTLRYLRERGYQAEVVEKYLPYAKRRKDLFDIIDIIAIDGKNILGVQSCSGSAFAEHDKKIIASPATNIWLASGGLLWLMGWRKKKLFRGSKAVRWKERIKEYQLRKVK